MITSWQNDVWSNPCQARNCSSGDLPSNTTDPYSNYDYLYNYFPPFVYGSSCASGYQETGLSYGSFDPARHCRYCGVNIVENMSCPGSMWTYYSDENNKVNCGFPAPPTMTCSSGMSVADPGILWDFPFDPDNWSTPLTEVKTYHYYCADSTENVFEVHYIIPDSSQSYSCGVSGTYLTTDDPVSNNTLRVLNYDGISITFDTNNSAADFYNITQSLICPSTGNVKGWKKITKVQ